MEITQTRRPARTIEDATVRFEGVTDETDAELRALAYPAVHENPSSCFGASVRRYNDGVVVVSIHRD